MRGECDDGECIDCVTNKSGWLDGRALGNLELYQSAIQTVLKTL